MLQSLSLSDPAWNTTLPHRLSPLADELLLGLLLRCDEVNHWEGRTTLAYLFRSSRNRSLNGALHLVVVAPWVIDTLDHLLLVPQSMLLATTYAVELARLYGTDSPHATKLSQRFSFRICPCCIAEARLIRRSVVLPHILFCPFHHVALLTRCQCGTILEAFKQQTHPFVCSACGLDWASLPLIPPPQERIELEQKLLSYYDFYFTKGTPELLMQALICIRKKLKKGKVSHVKLLDGRMKSLEHYELNRVSLGTLVELLICLDIPYYKNNCFLI
jgi:hypothetical protein